MLSAIPRFEVKVKRSPFRVHIGRELLPSGWNGCASDLPFKS
jgi:hypothetical protein